MPRPGPFLLVAILAAPVLADSVHGADTARGAAAYLPDDLAFVVTLRDGDQRAQALRGLLRAHRFTESPTYDFIAENPELTQARVFAVGLADTAGTDPWSGVGALLGRETVLGFALGADGPRFIVASVPRERALTDRVIDAIHVTTGLRRGQRPDPARSRTMNGVTVYALGDDVFHCRLDEAVVLASSADLVRGAIAAHRDGVGRLAESAAHRRAAARVPEEAIAWAYGDLEVVRPLLERAPHAPNPLAAVLLGGWWNGLRHADRVSLDVTPGTNRLEVAFHVEGEGAVPDTHAGFDPPGVHPPAWSADDMPDTLATITVARDWAHLFAERESLMTLAAASDFVNFTNTLTALMGSVDFVDDVLARVDGPIRAVFARQDFDDRPYAPTPELPAFALVLPLDLEGGADVARRLDSAALTAFGIINAEAGRKEQPTYLVDIQPYGRHRLVVAGHTEPAANDGDGGMRAADPGGDVGRDAVGVAYNFEPCTAVLEEHYIVATSPGLLREVIDAIDAAHDRPDPAAEVTNPAPDLATLSMPQLVEILRANRDALVMNTMLEDDKPRAVAERELDLVLGLLGYVERLELAAGRDAAAPSATLAIELEAPAPIAETP